VYVVGCKLPSRDFFVNQLSGSKL